MLSRPTSFKVTTRDLPGILIKLAEGLFVWQMPEFHPATDLIQCSNKRGLEVDII